MIHTNDHVSPEEQAMPRVPIKDLRQYERAIDVLTRVGGTYQAVGQDEWFLLVTDVQYRALVEANVVKPDNGVKDENRGTGSKKKTHV
jgi:hypothetical protein